MKISKARYIRHCSSLFFLQAYPILPPLCKFLVIAKKSAPMTTTTRKELPPHDHVAWEQLDHEFGKLLAQIPRTGPQPAHLNGRRWHFENELVPQARAIQIQFFLPKDEEYEIRDFSIPVDGYDIAIRGIVPVTNDDSDEPFPLMVWIFGAGGVSGSYDIDDLYLRRNAVDTKVSVVMMNYRLAPENPFPTGLNDCYNALKWIAEHTSLFSASIDRGFIMTGMCFGANLATALAFRARDDPFFEGRRPTGLGLQAPLLLHPELCPEKYESELKSRVTHKTARLMNMERLAKLATLYGAPLEHPEFSIILNEDYTNLPPTYVQVCGADPLRDEGRLLIKLLNQSGVETKIDEYPGLPHAGNRFFPEAQISKDWHNDWEEGIQWLVKLARPEENKTSDESL